MPVQPAGQRRFRCVEPLLRHGALPDAHGPTGATPLEMATSGGADPDAIRALLAHGANPNAHNKYGATPLMGTALTGSTENATALLDSGADPNARNRTGGTALMSAAEFGSPELLRLLIAHGADPNVRTRGLPELRQVAGRTALMEAAALERSANVVTLLAHGADPTLRDGDGHSAADVSEDPALAAMLRRAEAVWRARHPSGSRRANGQYPSHESGVRLARGTPAYGRVKVSGTASVVTALSAQQKSSGALPVSADRDPPWARPEQGPVTSTVALSVV
jgi:hypothetical protein